MESYVLCVWLLDRPGALGAVASRIGAVKGDVVGIEILETGAGQAIDELVVQLPEATLVAAPTRSELLAVVRDQAPRSLSATWVAVVDVEQGTTLVAGAGAPTDGWLGAFVHGASTAASLSGNDSTQSDVIWAGLEGCGLALVAGRDRIAWRDRERRQVDALADIVALRWVELPDDL